MSLSGTSLLKMEAASNLNFLSTISETLFQFGLGRYDGFESPGLLPMAQKLLQMFHPNSAGAQSVRFDETGGYRMRTAQPDLRAIRLPTA